MKAATDPSYKGLFKIAWVSALLAAVLFLISAAIAFYIGQTLGTFTSFLNLIGLQSLLATIGQASLTAGLVLLIPTVLALYVGLRGATIGRAMAGAGVWMTGIIVFLANTGNYFWLINLAQGYERYCVTNCQQINQQEAFAVNSVSLDLVTAELLLAIAIMIIGWAMLKSTSFGKGPGYLGIVSGAYAILGPLAAFYTNPDINFTLTSYPASFALVLYAAWFVVVSIKLRMLVK